MEVSVLGKKMKKEREKEGCTATGKGRGGEKVKVGLTRLGGTSPLVYVSTFG